MSSLLISILFLLLSAGTVRADFAGGRAPELQKSLLSDTMKARHERVCEDIGWLTMMRKTTCMAAVEKNKITDTSYEFCSKKSGPAEIVACLEDVAGRDYPAAYLSACDRVQAHKGSQRKTCLDYLARSRSSYDPEVFNLCVSKTGSNFDAARACLNAIRDRQINTQTILKDCSGLAENDLMRTAVLKCVEDRTDTAAMACSPPATTGEPAKKTGQH